MRTLLIKDSGRLPRVAMPGQNEAVLDPEVPLRQAAPEVAVPEMPGRPTETPAQRMAGTGRELLTASSIALAVVCWLLVGCLASMLVWARDDREGMTGFAVAVLMPLVLMPAFGLVSLAAWLGRPRWPGPVAPIVGVVAGVAAVAAPLAWWAVI